MGLIDSIYIVDDKDNLVFEHVINISSPTFHYVHNQLLTSKRELIVREGLKGIDNSQVVFNGDELLDPIVKLDSNWLVAWNKVDNLYVLALGSVEPDSIEVISDDENEDEENNDGKDQSEGEEGEEEEVDELGDGGKAIYAESPTAPHDEYNQLSSDEDKQLDEAEDITEEEEEEEELPDQEETTEEAVPESSPEPIIKAISKISNSTNPLQYFQFFKEFVFAAKIFLNTETLTKPKVEANSHKLLLLLQEMVDSSYPFITDLNQLRELLPNDSIINKIISTTKQLQNTATSSINNIKQGSNGILNNSSNSYSPIFSTIFEKSGNSTPWRKANVKHTQNEMFVDLYEKIDLILKPTKIKNRAKNNLQNSAFYSTPLEKHLSVKDQPYTKAIINGKIDFNSSLSGHPCIELQFEKLPVSKLFNNVSLHRCIDLPVWQSSQNNSLQFIPPDEKFTLLSYNLDLIDANSDEKLNLHNFTGLINAELFTGLGVNKNEFELEVNINLHQGVKIIENLNIEIFLPDRNNNQNSNYTIKVLRITNGTLQIKPNGRSYDWAFDKELSTGISFNLKGLILLENQLNDEVSSNDFDTRNGNGNGNDLEDSEKLKTIKPKFVKISYQNKGSIPTGLKVRSLKVLSGLNNKIKPFKGVKYTSTVGDYILR